MAESKVKVVDDGGVERYVRPVDAAEIVKAGGKYDEAEAKKEGKAPTQIIEGSATGRADSIQRVPVSPDSAREHIDYDLESGDGMPGGKIDVDRKAAGLVEDEDDDEAADKSASSKTAGKKAPAKK